MSDTPRRPDRHRDSGVLVRAPLPLRDQAQTILHTHDWQMTEFVVACLTLLTRNPNGFLTRLEDVRPTRRRGRPKKTGDAG